jgi:thiol-disulfide isomerase/thioredoxin
VERQFFQPIALETLHLPRRNKNQPTGIIHNAGMNAYRLCTMRSVSLIGLAAVGLMCVGPAPAFAQDVARAPAPEWQLTGLNGKTVKSSDFRGKVVILNFWTTWCVPCRVEIPHFVELQKQYGDKGLAIIGVSLDEHGPDAVKKFVKQIGVNYPIVVGDQKVVEAYGGIVAVPTSFVIDRQDRIASRHIGYEDKAVFEEEIQSLL